VQKACNEMAKVTVNSAGASIFSLIYLFGMRRRRSEYVGCVNGALLCTVVTILEGG
jgi:hypothetical protein